MERLPQLTTTTELHDFLGLMGYYHKFVKNYGIIAKPPTNLLKKKSFRWNEQAGAAFDTLKQAMVNTPVLALPDFALPFLVETDACAIGIGAVLMQQGHPIAYPSKALGPQNQRLPIYKKELLVVIMVVDKLWSYLKRGPFLILTNHKSLVIWMNNS